MAKKVWKLDEEGRNDIKYFENLELKVYLCDGDKWTIGWGTTKGVTENGVWIDGKRYAVITKDQAQRLFDRDIALFEGAVNRLVKVKLDQKSFNSLVSLVYNIGEGAFKESTLLELLNKGDYGGADAQFPVWVYAKKKKLKGLVTRRKKEQAGFNENLGDAVVANNAIAENVADDDVVLSKKEIPTIQKPLAQSRTVKAQTLQIASGSVVGTAGVIGATSEALQGVDLSGMSDTAYQAASVASSAGTLVSVLREHWAIIAILVGVIIIAAALWTLYAKINDRKAK